MSYLVACTILNHFYDVRQVCHRERHEDPYRHRGSGCAYPGKLRQHQGTVSTYVCVFTWTRAKFSSVGLQLARDAICSLILGSPPGKVYNQVRNVAKRLTERF
jgi:hypothetical protein